MRRAAMVLALLPLAGCIGTATSIVKAPFKVAGKAVDWTTTSQSESDRNYGRAMRKKEEREGRARRAWARECRDTPDAQKCRTYTGYTAARGG